MVLTLERGVDLFMNIFPVVGLNLTWHSAALIGSVGELNCHHGRDVGVICQGRVGLGVVLRHF